MPRGPAIKGISGNIDTTAATSRNQKKENK
jgi:hypothetical protein